LYDHFLEEHDKYYITHRSDERSSLSYTDTAGMLTE